MKTETFPSLTEQSLRPGIRKCEYAVRGAILLKAMELEKKIKSGENLPFKEISYCNLGNPQHLGQQPITFNRQVLSAACNKELLNSNVYPPSVVKRAKSYYEHFESVGAYTESQGLHFVRESVAKYFENRDGAPSDPENIYLGNGASELIKNILDFLINDESVGIMISIPQYPLYSADITKCGGQLVPYYLQEDQNWLNLTFLSLIFRKIII